MDLVKPFAVRQLTSVTSELVGALSPLLDDGVEWDAKEGDRFLANPDCLFLLAEAESVPVGFLTAYRLQRFDQRRAEVQLYEYRRRRGLAAARGRDRTHCQDEPLGPVRRRDRVLGRDRDRQRRRERPLHCDRR